MGPAPPGSDEAGAWRRNELKAFLRARREALAAPTSPPGGRRRTAGWRREEVAQAAGVGVSWYTWLEQGRDINISASALGRIARALRLSPADEAYLFWLGGQPLAPPPWLGEGLPPTVGSLLRRHASPAMLLDRAFNILGMNALAAELYPQDRAVPPFPRNQMWQLVANPERRALFVDYEDDLRHMTWLFRMSCGAGFEDPAHRAVLEALLGVSPDFRGLWAAQQVAPMDPRRSRLRHPQLGALAIESVRFPYPSAAGGLLVFLEPADAETARVFEARRPADAGEAWTDGAWTGAA